MKEMPGASMSTTRSKAVIGSMLSPAACEHPRVIWLDSWTQRGRVMIVPGQAGKQGHFVG
jgi:hypothetical protein